MFTGLVVAVGRVEARRPAAGGVELDVDLGAVAEAASVGDSIALSGVCCTVAALAGGSGRFFLSTETVARTWLGRASAGTLLNLEPALRAGEPLGGHLVQGHVDAVGEVVEAVDPSGGDWSVRLPAGVLRYCVVKGSIALDGVSLTIAAIDGDLLRLAIIPHTAAATTIGALPAGAPLNVEVDVVAKYVERMLGGWLEAGRGPPGPPPGGG